MCNINISEVADWSTEGWEQVASIRAKVDELTARTAPDPQKARLILDRTDAVYHVLSPDGIQDRAAEGLSAGGDVDQERLESITREVFEERRAELQKAVDMLLGSAGDDMVAEVYGRYRGDLM